MGDYSTEFHHTDSPLEHVGYCPQVNPLWPRVTLQEHLEIYAAIKGLRGPAVPGIISRWVQLLNGFYFDWYLKNIYFLKISVAGVEGPDWCSGLLSVWWMLWSSRTTWINKPRPCQPDWRGRWEHTVLYEPGLFPLLWTTVVGVAKTFPTKCGVYHQCSIVRSSGLSQTCVVFTQ